MGRRSINTTKSGKYMNPTDQARKEARKRELKKNKKQRQMVRAAVLKGKDPLQIISDMEKIDEMEYNVDAPPLLNEKVLKDKRKKLKETWDRVMRLYAKEDRERYLELKKLEIEYENRRAILMKYFESVRVTQQVIVDDIPLPSAPDMPLYVTSQIPLPNELELPELAEQLQAPHSILKKSSFFPLREDYPGLLRPPGVPAGPPPELSSDEEDERDDELEEPMEEDVEEEIQNKEIKTKTRKIRFADESTENSKEDEDSGEDEGEETETKDVEENGEQLALQEADGMEKEETEQAEDIAAPAAVDDDNATTIKPLKPEDIPIPPVQLVHQVPLPTGPPPRLPQGPPPIMFRPPPLRPGIPPPPRLLPPGVPPPPPGRPSLPPPGLPLRLGAPPIRLPPGPPPGIPPLRLIRPPPSIPPPRLPPSVTSVLPLGQPSSNTSAATTMPNAIGATLTATGAAASAVLSAPPSLMQRPKHAMPTEEETKRAATIEAKPQIRNLSADVMRFMPTTLRVKREDRHKKGASKGASAYEATKEAYPTAAPVSNPSASAPTKDDAYQQFLREMEELL